MDQFKLDLFKQEFDEPLLYQVISVQDEIKLENILFSFEVNVTNKSDLFNRLLKNLPYKVLYKNLESTNNVQNLLEKFNITDEKVNLIWSYPDEIDSLSISYLIDDWKYIWYATSDEAVILFFAKTNLLILITDYGVYYHN
ncbi:hypothetical protein [Spirosoma validum]|uniref:Uncharacterized protein n=1 Tax=Spirosoma validum TaxID=2771355 RepID=A0A927B8V6_9BACT|nr:hypothetical protein [Spirosoma validum]MBD2757896.1 hypothetical protein [Spirosoma validum]